VGDVVDARDRDGQWYEGKLLEIQGNEAKVHFRGWLPKFDAWIPLDSDSLRPLHSVTHNWREALTVGGTVEVTGPSRIECKTREWFLGKVVNLDRRNGMALVSYHDSGKFHGMKTWVELEGDLICCPNTHLLSGETAGLPPSNEL